MSGYGLETVVRDFRPAPVGWTAYTAYWYERELHIETNPLAGWLVCPVAAIPPEGRARDAEIIPAYWDLQERRLVGFDEDAPNTVSHVLAPGQDPPSRESVVHTIIRSFNRASQFAAALIDEPGVSEDAKSAHAENVHHYRELADAMSAWWQKQPAF